MIAYVFFKPINVSQDYESALMSDSPDELTRFSAPLEQAFKDIKQWTELEGMGRVLCSFGFEISIQVPITKLDELSKFIQKFEDTTHKTFAIGVGMCPTEAYKAMCVSENECGERVVLYSKEMEENGQLIEKAWDFGQEYGDKFTIDLPGLDLDKEEEPDTGQYAEDAPAEQPSAQGEEAPQPEQAQEAPTDDQPEEKESGKQKIVKALMMIKQNSDAIAQLKSIKPEAFQAVKQIVDAMILMAQGDMSKSEKTEDSEETSEESSSESSKLKKEEPVGKIKNHRIKVEARDELTREKTGEHWHKVSDGMIMGATGHPVSPNKPPKE